MQSTTFHGFTITYRPDLRKFRAYNVQTGVELLDESILRLRQTIGQLEEKEDYVQIYDDHAEEILNFLEVWDDFDGRSYEDEREWKREIVGTALAKGWEQP